jgi:hypothetical protein
LSVGGQFASAPAYIDNSGNLKINGGNQVAQMIGSGATGGKTVWSGTTDPGVSAGEGDVWVKA